MVNITHMAEDLSGFTLQQCENFIKTNYIRPLIQYLAGEQGSVTNPKMFQNCRTAINEQCDSHDRSKQMHVMYLEIVADYFAE